VAARIFWSHEPRPSTSHIGERRDVAGVRLHARRAFRPRRQLHMLRCACRGFHASNQLDPSFRCFDRAH
jgi:hypothetical protein